MLPSGLLRFDTLTARLRLVAYVEGCSYLALLFVAMPLKYLADQPLAVRYTGMAHGLLFIALGWLTLQTMLERRKPFGWAARIGLLAVLPFGTFFLDGDLAREDAAARGASS